MKFGLKYPLIYIFAKCLNSLSRSKRAEILIAIIRSSVKQFSPKETLRFLFELENRLYLLEGKASVEYGKGIHTKHRHINYHRFFIENLNPGESVLDIGSGNGLMSYDMVTQVPGVSVVGIELNEANIKFARTHYQHPNLNFIHGDALKELPNEKFDVVTLSNVLEHIEQRSLFLKRIVSEIKPIRLIIRIPFFERDWRVPLKKELKVDYHLDSSHFIEYTQEEFSEELKHAGLKGIHTEFRWGEIWSVVESIQGGG